MHPARILSATMQGALKSRADCNARGSRSEIMPKRSTPKKKTSPKKKPASSRKRSSSKAQKSPVKAEKPAKRSGGKAAKKKPAAKPKRSEKGQKKPRLKQPAKRAPRELISGRAYSRRRHVHHSTVQAAIESGRISTFGGLIDPELADREWAERTDPSTPRNSVIGNPKRRRKKGEPAMPMDLDRAQDRELDARGQEGRSSGGNGSASDYAEARARREGCLARMAELELEERLGNLVQASLVRKQAFESAQKTRTQLTGIPERVAHILATMPDAHEIQVLLEDEIEEICKELSGANARARERS